MTDLSQHIQYLLRHHDCVILPGTGAFVKSYVPAAPETDGSLLPPRTEISFNPSITTDDGLLAHSLMRRTESTFEQARATVAQATEELRSSLKTDRETLFGSLGTFSLGEDDNLCFTPFAAYPLPFTKTTPFAIEDKAASDETTPGHGRRFDTVRNYYIAVNKRFAKVAAALLIVVAAASTFVVPSLDNSTLTLPRVDRASVVPVPTKKALTEKPVASLVEVSNETPDADPHAEVASEPQKGLSYLVVGTFRTLNECDKFIASQPSDANLKIAAGKKLCRVYAAASTDRDELLSTLREDSFLDQYPQAWIWQP